MCTRRAAALARCVAEVKYERLDPARPFAYGVRDRQISMNGQPGRLYILVPHKIRLGTGI